MTIRTDSKQGLPQPGLDAAREGRSFCHWANAQAALNAAATVVTAGESTLNMVPGYRYIVRCIYYQLTTASDTIRYELGVSSLPNGGGVFTAHTPHFQSATAATIEGSPTGPIPLDPPICLTVDSGACICMRVLTNDAGATVNVGFTGWREEAI
jgi:hypothetical protein